MIQSTKDTPMLAGSPQQSLDTVPAAWPSGVLSLAQVLEACQRPAGHEVSVDRQVRTPKAIQRTPSFRRNAVELTRDKTTKDRS